MELTRNEIVVMGNSAEWAGGVFQTLRRWLAPAVVGRQVDSGPEMQERLAAFKGNPFAKAALDNA